jgi:hypothetical protein
MVNPVSSGGYQAYAYQQQTTPVQEPRGGDNRVTERQAPAADSQRADQRSLASRDENTSAARREAQNDDTRDTGGGRGTTLDVVV